MDSELRAELLRRAEQGQAARLGVIGQRDDRELDWEPVFGIDADNVTWLGALLALHGVRGSSRNLGTAMNSAPRNGLS